MKAIPLYRPYLSETELDLIISALDSAGLAKTDTHKKLVEFRVKVAYNLVKPAAIVTRKVREKLSESLGFSDDSDNLTKLPAPAPVIYMPELSASPQVTYDTLATKSMEGTITETEKSQGAELEMKLFGFNSGMFE